MLGFEGVRRRGRFTRLVLIAVVATAALAFQFRRPWFSENFGVVEAGRVYRMAQPRSSLPALLRERRVASVLNLRGGAMADPWYAAEVEATRRLGVDLYDYPMSATRRPRRDELRTLVDVLSRCKYPLLIHCKAGSDRTGLASALYLLTQKQSPPQVALGAFTLDHGHVALFGPERLHEPLDEYAAWLRATHQTHTAARFRAWLEREYRDEGAAPLGPLPALHSGPRPARAAQAKAEVSTRR